MTNSFIKGFAKAAVAKGFTPDQAIACYKAAAQKQEKSRIPRELAIAGGIGIASGTTSHLTKKILEAGSDDIVNKLAEKVGHADISDISPGAAVGGLANAALPAGLGGVIGYNVGESFGQDPQQRKNFRRAGGAAGALIPLLIQAMMRRD